MFILTLLDNIKAYIVVTGKNVKLTVFVKQVSSLFPYPGSNVAAGRASISKILL